MASRQQIGNIAAEMVIKELQRFNYKLLNKERMLLSLLSPNKRPFFVVITSLSRRNSWIIPNCKDLKCYYVLVFKPDNKNSSFFILTPEEMFKESERHIKSRMKPILLYSNPELEKMGLAFSQPFSYENRWESLPQ